MKRSGMGSLLFMGLGMVLGWLGSEVRPGPMQASTVDRTGNCIVATGPVLVEYDEGTRSSIPLEALYFLDYKGARLLATVPSYKGQGTKTQILDRFAERDLAADFGLDGDARPRFLMATGSLGRYNAGWAPLYVFETTTGQVAVYRMKVGDYGKSNAAQFELVERRRYGDAPEVEAQTRP